MSADERADSLVAVGDIRLRLGVLVPTAGVVLGCLVLLVAWTPDLPADVASQWSWSTGDVRTVRQLWPDALLTVAMATIALLGLVGLELADKLTGWGRRLSVGAITAIAVFLAATDVVMVRNQRGLTDPLLAPDPRADVAALAVGALACGLLAAWIVGGRPLHERPQPGIEASTLSLSPGEVTVWARTVTAWVFLLGGVAAGCGLVFAASVSGIWPLALIGAAALAAGLACSRWTVTVDHRGLTCTSTGRVVRFRLAPGPGASADVIQIKGSTEFLGWGLRIGSAGSRALIFRNGEALGTRHAHGRSLTITVPDAHTGAAAFNAAVVAGHDAPSAPPDVDPRG